MKTKINIVLNIITVFATVVLLTGCVHDDIAEPIREDNKGLKESSLVLYTPSNPKASKQSPSTRAITESSEYDYWIKDLDILLFDESGLFDKRYYFGNFTEAQQSQAIREIKVKLPSSGKYQVVLLANVHDELSLSAPVAGSTKESVLNSLKLSLGAGNKWNSTPGSSGYRHFPMWGETDGTVTLPKQGSDKIEVTLARIFAKVNIIAPSNYKLDHISVYNYATKGYIAPNPVKWNDRLATEVSGSRSSDPLIYNQSYIKDDVDINSNPIKKCVDEIFLFEASKGSTATLANNTFIIIGGLLNGTNYYYRLDFIDNDNNYLDIVRNYKYIFNISHLQEGYSSIADAISDKNPRNLVVDLIVWDDANIGEVVFNGQNMMSVSTKAIDFSTQVAVAESKSIYIVTDYKNNVDDNKSGWKIDKIVDENDEDITSNSTVSKNWLSANTMSWKNPNDIKEVTLVAQPTALKDRTGFVHISAGQLKYVVEVKQSAIRGMLAPPGIIGIDKNGVLTVDGATEDNPVFMVYFKWGSLIALKGGPAPVTGQSIFSDSWSGNTSTEISRVAWYPREYEPQINNIKNYSDVPYFNSSSFANASPYTFHYPEMGIGDPCRLVYSKDANYNRLPRMIGSGSSMYYEGYSYGNWNNQEPYPGAPLQPGRLNTNNIYGPNFFPAAGYRFEAGLNNISVIGTYWSGTAVSNGNYGSARGFYFDQGTTPIDNLGDRSKAYAVRCIPVTDSDLKWNVSPTNINLGYHFTGKSYNYESFLISINDDSKNYIPWTITSDSDWLKIDSSPTGTGNSSISLTGTATLYAIVDPNNDPLKTAVIKPRTGTLTIKRGGQTKTITVTQSMLGVLAWPGILGVDMDGNLTLDGATAEKPAYMLYFKWGSLIGIMGGPPYLGNASISDLWADNTTTNIKRIAWYPKTSVYGEDIGFSENKLNQIYNMGTSPTDITNTVPFLHLAAGKIVPNPLTNKAEAREGRGDPCRLAFLNGVRVTNYRMPIRKTSGSSGFYEGYEDIGSATLPPYDGAPLMVGRKNNQGNPYFFPAAGMRTHKIVINTNFYGAYWCNSVPTNSQNAYVLSVTGSGFNNTNNNFERVHALPIRCIAEY